MTTTRGRIACALALACLGCCRCTGPSPGGARPELLTFAIVLPPAQAVVDAATGAVSVPVPAGTDLSHLVAAFTVAGDEVTVAGVPQESAVTANDFRAPVTYAVRAAGGAESDYVVTVTAAQAPRSDKEITSFGLANPPAPGALDASLRRVTVTVPHGTSRAGLVAVFETSGAAVSVDGVAQVSGATANDFTEPVEYVVMAEDGSTASWLVTIACLPGTSKEITSFSAGDPAVDGIIDTGSGIVRVRLPPGTDLSRLVPRFSTTGVLVTVQGEPQESGVSANDFTGPVEYVVTAEDGSSRAWSVRVIGTIDLVINELDVDQPGTDTAEFVELFSRSGVDLAGLCLVLVNGGSLPGVEYARVDLGSAGGLEPGGFLVVAGPGVTAAPGALRLTPAGWELSNRIQNGPSDAAAILDVLGHRLVDTVAYNGALHRALLAGESAERDLTEGAAGAPADSGSAPGAVGRAASGQDTGQNGADFRLSSPPTPGAANN